VSLLPANEGKTITYRLRPTRRGVYSFGYVRVFVTGRIGLVSRCYTCAEPLDIKVYPSYLMLHQYELLAISDNLTELGIKRIRRIGHHTEFEQIKEYVKGDDYRTINWKASARRHELMVNVYQDERSQQIYESGICRPYAASIHRIDCATDAYQQSGIPGSFSTCIRSHVAIFESICSLAGTGLRDTGRY
jgi:hypothetical protein